MRGSGKHLTWNDRLIIEKMLKNGCSKPQIARYLGVHHSTIYEEVKRGEVELVDTELRPYKTYSPEKAELYHERKKKNMEKIFVDAGVITGEIKPMHAVCNVPWRSCTEELEKNYLQY